MMGRTTIGTITGPFADNAAGDKEIVGTKVDATGDARLCLDRQAGSLSICCIGNVSIRFTPDAQNCSQDVQRHIVICAKLLKLSGSSGWSRFRSRRAKRVAAQPPNSGRGGQLAMYFLRHR